MRSRPQGSGGWMLLESIQKNCYEKDSLSARFNIQVAGGLPVLCIVEKQASMWRRIAMDQVNIGLEKKSMSMVNSQKGD
jgi:hypothetical protein